MRELLGIQAKCREWGDVLRRNGWDSDKMAAARTPEAKAMEIDVMALIKKHETIVMYCRNNFVRDPSTALDRAFDYIGIYLNRKPEALKLTVGLPECLTVEAVQPNVEETHQEPTFIIQIGKWARRLSELTDQASSRVKLKPSRQEAYRMYVKAMQECRNLATDRQVYDWITENVRILPYSFNTFTRYLTEARKYHGTKKHNFRDRNPFW